MNKSDLFDCSSSLFPYRAQNGHTSAQSSCLVSVTSSRFGVQRGLCILRCRIRWMGGRISLSKSLDFYRSPLPNLPCFRRLIKDTPALQDIVISLVATYGLFFISSFMHFEPWHMFTSFIQYLFFLPSCEFFRLVSTRGGIIC